MIVVYEKEGWHIVTQRAHGILAAQLATHWKKAKRPARWTETLLAIAEHDDAEVEMDGENLLTSAGGPLNFDMKVFEQLHCEKLAMLSQMKSRYIALLTSMHMEFLYRQDANAQKFLAQQERLRAKWMKELKITKTEVEKIYDLLEWCDACSLLLCQQLMQPEKRKLEISTGPDKKIYNLAQVDEAYLTITPWPFEETDFTVNFEFRVLHQLQFDSAAEFRKVFQSVKIQEKTWRFKKYGNLKPKKKISNTK